MILENVLPRLFFKMTKTLSPAVVVLSTMLIMNDGLGLLNPLTPAQEKYLISQRVRTELVRSVTGGWSFSNTDHLCALSEEQCDGKKDQDAA